MKSPLSVSRFVEAAPLVIFLVYAETIDRSQSQNWILPYFMSSTVAVIISAGFFITNKPLNPVFIGINLYLISGCLGLLAGLSWLNEWYGQLEAAGMLLWVVIVGMFLTAASLISRALNFVGPASRYGRNTFFYSSALLMVAIFALCLSFSFREDKFLSEYAPFIIIFTTQSILKIMLSMSKG